MNTLRQIETKKDLAAVPKKQKVSVTFTRDEFDFLTDLIETYEQIQIELMTETQLNRGLICAQLRSLRIVRERMSDASQKAGGI